MKDATLKTPHESAASVSYTHLDVYKRQIRESLAQRNGGSVSRGTVVLATVKGDIHDIGKNIVKVLLENYY